MINYKFLRLLHLPLAVNRLQIERDWVCQVKEIIRRGQVDFNFKIARPLSPVGHKLGKQLALVSETIGAIDLLVGLKFYHRAHGRFSCLGARRHSFRHTSHYYAPGE